MTQNVGSFVAVKNPKRGGRRELRGDLSFPGVALLETVIIVAATTRADPDKSPTHEVWAEVQPGSWGRIGGAWERSYRDGRAAKWFGLAVGHPAVNGGRSLSLQLHPVEDTEAPDGKPSAAPNAYELQWKPPRAAGAMPRTSGGVVAPIDDELPF